MAQHYAIMLLCAVLAFAFAFYAIGLGTVSEVAVLAGLLCEGMFWARVSRTLRMRLNPDCPLRNVTTVRK